MTPSDTSGADRAPLTVRSGVARITEGRRAGLLTLGLTSFMVGLSEALFLVVVTRAAFAVSEGGEEFDLGPWRLGVTGALWIGAGLVSLRLVAGTAAAAQMASLVSESVRTIRRRLAHSFLRADWAAQEQDRAGHLQELLTTFTLQMQTLTSSIAVWTTNAFNLAALLGLAFVVNPPAALAVAVLGAVVGTVFRPLRAAIRARGRQAADTGMTFATSLSEISDLGLEVHVFGVHRQAERRIEELIDSNTVAERRLSLSKAVVPVLYVFLAYLAVLVALAAVHALGETDLAGIGAVMLIVLRSLTYGLSLQVATTQVSSSLPYLDDLEARLAQYDAARRRDDGLPVERVGPLALDGVSFAYRPGHPVLRDLTFTVAEREVLGIVGPSGSGKSTLVQLLLGLRDPDSGAVLADGRPVQSLSPAEWARKVTFVPQAAHLVTGTIRENIRFFRDGVTDADIERAAAQAHLLDDVLADSDGFDRVVGGRSGGLSGGQQQRLCIARALVERPDVLILDEPTSALDARSEQLIRATLAELSADMTVVIIAHRLSTLDICDRILVLQDGEVKGLDTPASLATGNDFYREALALSGLR